MKYAILAFAALLVIAGGAAISWQDSSRRAYLAKAMQDQSAGASAVNPYAPAGSADEKSDDWIIDNDNRGSSAPARNNR